MQFAEKLYTFLPYPMQNVLCTLRSLPQRRLRYGGVFREKLRWLKNSQWWSHERICSYQTSELKRILSLAFAEVPYYRNLIMQSNVKISDISSISDLAYLPLLSKEDLLMHSNSLLSANADKGNLVRCKSGGTTGKSVSFYQEPSAIQFRWAVWWRHRLRFGIDFDSSYATFTGLAAVPVDVSKPPFWRENRLMRQTVFNMHHIVPEKLKPIVARLNTGGFVYYSGYPSILYHLATLIEAEGFKIKAAPKMVFTGAETLTLAQQNTLERVFHAPVSDLYGFSEGAGNASKCEYGVYHEDFEFGILECCNPEQLGNNRVRGEIVATGFASSAMPLIRYRVGDIGIWEEKDCPCGRKSKILVSIEGRCEDYVVLPEGGRIRRFDYIFKDSVNVMEAQVLQKTLGAITIKIVKRNAYTNHDEQKLRNEVATKISRSLKVEFEYVEKIEREANGKFRAVKSLLQTPDKLNP